MTGIRSSHEGVPSNRAHLITRLRASRIDPAQCRRRDDRAWPVGQVTASLDKSIPQGHRRGCALTGGLIGVFWAAVSPPRHSSMLISGPSSPNRASHAVAPPLSCTRSRDAGRIPVPGRAISHHHPDAVMTNACIATSMAPLPKRAANASAAASVAAWMPLGSRASISPRIGDPSQRPIAGSRW